MGIFKRFIAKFCNYKKVKSGTDESKKPEKITIPIIYSSSGKSLIHTLFDASNDFIDDVLVDNIKSKLIKSKDKDLEFVVHTDGGDMSSIKQICDSIIVYKKENPTAKVSVIVPYKSFSAGTLMLLLADELVFSNYTHLSPFDVQVNDNFTPADYAELVTFKQIKCDDKNVLHNQVCQRVRETFDKMLEKYIKYSPRIKTEEQIEKIKKLGKGDMLHSHLLSIDELDEYGIVPDRMDELTLKYFKKIIKNNKF
uniref:Serine dehydrogenase proteinase n=1 Tax=viral metagenome TaxID=1070528 RepID=A0A6C0EDI3_9ZZZZ